MEPSAASPIPCDLLRRHSSTPYLEAVPSDLPEIELAANLNVPQLYADGHRLLTYSLQSTRHRLAYMAFLHSDAEIDKAAAKAVAGMERLHMDLLRWVPELEIPSGEALKKVVLERTLKPSTRWKHVILDDCYTRWAFLAEPRYPLSLYK